MARVYLDTSFVSACVTTRTDASSVARAEVSREWWSTQRRFHELVVSTEVTRELDNKAFGQRTDALSLIADLKRLDIDESVVGVAEVFIQHRLMPGPLGGDAVHVAVCCVHRVDYLLSWNVRHLANPNKIDHLAALCRRLALTPPAIVIPDLLWESDT